MYLLIMNKLYHFGDSYSNVKIGSKHYVNLLSEKLNLEYNHFGVGGSSNELILNDFLGKIFEYRFGDVLFFNFSYFVRGTYYDKEKKKIMSSNYFVSDLSKQYRDFDLKGLEYVMNVFDYQIKNMEDYNRKVFDKFDIVFELLINKGIKIYYQFIENSEFSDDLLKHGVNIKIDDGFYNWLCQMDYHKEEDGHYSKGVQSNILDYIIGLYPDLTSKSPRRKFLSQII